jgi:hypothetical protein
LKHEEYDSLKVVNDIAIITLENNVEFNEHIQPACLPSSDPTIPAVDSKVVLAGWGLTKDKDDSSSPNLLQNVVVSIYDPIFCRLDGVTGICLGIKYF